MIVVPPGRLEVAKMRPPCSSTIRLHIASPSPDPPAEVSRVLTFVVKKGLKAGDVVREVAPVVGGGGGGRPNMAQAGGKDPEKLELAMTKIYAYIEENLK